MKGNILFILSIAVIIGLAVFVWNSSSNIRARSYGGTMTIKIPKGQKLINITWKEAGSAWYLTRPMRAGEEAEVHTFQEESNFGMVEGTIVVVESK
jgi:hypothetical protein